MVEVSGDRLIAGQQGERALAEIYVYAYDSENRLRDFSAQTVRVDLATNREKLEGRGLRYYGRLSLPAGDYRLRVLVRNAETGRMGLAVENLHVPDFADQKAYVAPPLFLESPAAGIVVNGRAGAQGASGGHLGSRAGERRSPAVADGPSPKSSSAAARAFRSWRTGSARRSRTT